MGGTLQEDLAAVRCVEPDRNGVFEIAPRSKSRRRPRRERSGAECGHAATAVRASGRLTHAQKGRLNKKRSLGCVVGFARLQ
jgi:hypothetical protein